MYLIELTYLKSLEQIDQHLEAHKAFLSRYYEKGKFIVSGRKNPRTGGLILCVAQDEQELKKIISEDPFHIYEVADYKITEFIPTMFQPQLETILQHK